MRVFFLRMSVLSLILLTSALLATQRIAPHLLLGHPPITHTQPSIEIVQGSASVDRVGIVRPLTLDEQLRRGERVTTSEGRAKIRFGHSVLSLDKRTDLVLEDLRDTSLTVRLVRGRIAVQGTTPITLLTPHASWATTSNVWSAVRYDFLDETQYFNLTLLPTHVTIQDSTTTFVEGVGLREIRPFLLTPIIPDLTHPNVQEFYRFAHISSVLSPSFLGEKSSEAELMQ